jgi:hypothetical protein
MRRVYAECFEHLGVFTQAVPLETSLKRVLATLSRIHAVLVCKTAPYSPRISRMRFRRQ